MLWRNPFLRGAIRCTARLQRDIQSHPRLLRPADAAWPSIDFLSFEMAGKKCGENMEFVRLLAAQIAGLLVALSIFTGVLPSKFAVMHPLHIQYSLLLVRLRLLKRALRRD